MLYIYVKTKNALVQRIELNIKNQELPQNILWVDLLRPSDEELAFISSCFDLIFPTREESAEIELSAKYWEDSENITINAHFLVRNQGENNEKLHTEIVSFMSAKNILFSMRYTDFSTFEEIQARILASPKNFEDGFDIIHKMLEVRVEKDADLLEWIDKEARRLRSTVLEKRELQNKNYDEMLGEISHLQELNMRVRDSLFDKRRTMTSLLISDKIDRDIKQNLTIVLKDLNSLVEFSVSQLNILDNIQSILASQINIEQNKIIKLFTVATVAMMPPTLIGTIYGMNFEFMPELHSIYGYPVVLGVMVISIILPVIFFKKKGWL